MRHFAFRCHKMNSLLKKLEYVTVVELMKTCQVTVCDRQEIIFSKEKRPISSYIILWGKVAIVDNETKAQNIY
jgi:hypothetical protein